MGLLDQILGSVLAKNSGSQASGGLGDGLGRPELVHHMTPEGRLPADDGGQVDTAFADLRRSLGM
jgi:uncharacterized protein YidB (DUF937 family)